MPERSVGLEPSPQSTVMEVTLPSTSVAESITETVSPVETVCEVLPTITEGGKSLTMIVCDWTVDEPLLSVAFIVIINPFDCLFPMLL